jgi:hypothetical protein
MPDRTRVALQPIGDLARQRGYCAAATASVAIVFLLVIPRLAPGQPPRGPGMHLARDHEALRASRSS